MANKDCGANCTNRCSVGECRSKDEFDSFILDIEEEEISKRNAEKEQAATTEACKLNDDGTCDGCTI